MIAGRVLLMFKGDYSSSETYHILDCVRYNNKTWVCKRDSFSNTPVDGDYWQMLVADGKAIVDFNEEIDGSNHNFTVTYNDGSEPLRFTIKDGNGDMLQDDYDSNHDGIVNEADKARAVGNASTPLLEKFSTTSQGQLLFDGNPVGGEVEVDDETITKNEFDELTLHPDVSTKLQFIDSDVWTSGKLYEFGDVCIYNNKIYKCISNVKTTEPPTNIDKWTETSLSAIEKIVSEDNSKVAQLESFKNNIEKKISSDVRIYGYSNRGFITVYTTGFYGVVAIYDNKVGAVVDNFEGSGKTGTLSNINKYTGENAKGKYQQYVFDGNNHHGFIIVGGQMSVGGLEIGLK